MNVLSEMAASGRFRPACMTAQRLIPAGPVAQNSAQLNRGAVECTALNFLGAEIMSIMLLLMSLQTMRLL